VYVPVDAVASRAGREADSEAAVAQLEAAGAVITTAEAVLWQLVPGARAFPAFMRSILTEIYLCHACSCQTRGIEDGNGADRRHEHFGTVEALLELPSDGDSSGGGGDGDGGDGGDGGGGDDGDGGDGDSDGGGGDGDGGDGDSDGGGGDSGDGDGEGDGGDGANAEGSEDSGQE
jgi:hypothetical protein